MQLVTEFGIRAHQSVQRLRQARNMRATNPVVAVQAENFSTVVSPETISRIDV
ncbi:MAG: hypothetical protein ACI8P9_003729 [Parasphingorhabdus sp.]|jgi:hypothetical protein